MNISSLFGFDPGYPVEHYHYYNFKYDNMILNYYIEYLKLYEPLSPKGEKFPTS